MHPSKNKNIIESIEIKYIDGHMHIHELFQKWNTNCLYGVWNQSMMISKNRATLDYMVAHTNWIHASQNLINVKFTVGVHPKSANQNIDRPRLGNLARHPNCVGIGECGLDYTVPMSRLPTQQAVLRRQMMLADKLNKPLILHC